MRICWGLIGLVAVAIATPAASEAQTSGTGQDNDPCATAPRNGNGDHLVQSLCTAIRAIASGEPERVIGPPRTDPAQPAELKLWRNTNGTAIDIDFGGGPVGAATIARLLSGSVFVPTERIDLLVVRNAAIEGVLDLSNATIEVAVKFNNVGFNLQEDGSCGPAVAGDQALPAAIELTGTHAKKRLSLIDSRVCGILINGSTLDGGVEIAGPGPDGSRPAESTISDIIIIKSEIKSDTSIKRTELDGDLLINRSDINSITLVDVNIMGQTQVSDNEIGALSSWRTTFGDRVQISNNHVRAELQLAVATFKAPAPPQIRDNLVDGSLQITIRDLPRKDTDLDLQLNKVGRASDVWLPEDWRGALNLNNTTFESVLSLCIAAYDQKATTLVPSEAEAAAEEKLQDCRDDSGRDRGMTGARSAARANEHASARDGADHMTVNLNSAEIGTLAWHLPLDCSMRWEGTGLRYDNWGEGRSRNGREETYECQELRIQDPAQPEGRPLGPTESLMMMRHVLVRDDVDTLDTMADYLAARGQVVESREIRQAAKKANYGTPAQPIKEWGVEDWSRAIAGKVLWPVGYGAKPELALIWLGLLWLISYAIYEVYSLTLRRSWQREIKAGSADAAGYSSVPGFKQFDKDQDPKEFEIFRYSIDAMLPVINLHTYDRYYTRNRALRVYAGVQHAVGWFLITIFLVSAAIL